MNTQTIAKRLAGRIHHARKASRSKRYNTALRAQERVRVLTEVLDMINSYRQAKGLQ